MSIAVDKAHDSNISDLTTASLGFIYAALCEPQGVDTARVHAFSEAGPFPFSAEPGNDVAEQVQNTALNRPVAVKFEQSAVKYDAQRDERSPGDALPQRDTHIGNRLRWNGNKYTTAQSDEGAIKLVQSRGRGASNMVLTSLNPNGNLSLGNDDSFRAHGATLHEHLVDALNKQYEHAGTLHELQSHMEEMEEALDEDDERTVDQAEMEKVANRIDQYQQSLQQYGETIGQYLKYLDLAFGDSVIVDYESGTFAAVPGQDRTAEAQYMAESVANSLSFIEPEEWYESAPNADDSELEPTFA